MADRGGPKVTLTLALSCSGCMYEQSVSYRVQGDSGFHVYCTRFNPKKSVGDTTWDTPDWCPLRQTAIDESQPALDEFLKRFTKSTR